MRSEVERNLGAQCVPLARGCLQLLTVGSDPTVLRLLVHLAGLSDDLSRTLVHGLLSRDREGQFDPLLLLLRSISQEATMELLKLLCMSDTGPGMQRCVGEHRGDDAGRVGCRWFHTVIWVTFSDSCIDAPVVNPHSCTPTSPTLMYTHLPPQVGYDASVVSGAQPGPLGPPAPPPPAQVPCISRVAVPG